MVQHASIFKAAAKGGCFEAIMLPESCQKGGYKDVGEKKNCPQIDL